MQVSAGIAASNVKSLTFKRFVFEQCLQIGGCLRHILAQSATLMRLEVCGCLFGEDVRDFAEGLKKGTLSELYLTDCGWSSEIDTTSYIFDALASGNAPIRFRLCIRRSRLKIDSSFTNLLRSSLKLVHLDLHGCLVMNNEAMDQFVEGLTPTSVLKTFVLPHNPGLYRWLSTLGRALSQHNPSLEELFNLDFVWEDDFAAFLDHLPRIRGLKAISYNQYRHATFFAHHDDLLYAVKRNDLERIFVFIEEDYDELDFEYDLSDRLGVPPENPFQGRVLSFHLKVNRNGLRPLLTHFHDNEVPPEVAIRLEQADDGLDFIYSCLCELIFVRHMHL
jgi:hypothetical protein